MDRYGFEAMETYLVQLVAGENDRASPDRWIQLAGAKKFDESCQFYDSIVVVAVVFVARGTNMSMRIVFLGLVTKLDTLK